MQDHPAHEFMTQVIREAWMRYITHLLDYFPLERFDLWRFGHYLNQRKDISYPTLAHYFFAYMEPLMRDMYFKFMSDEDVAVHRRELVRSMENTAKLDSRIVWMSL
jgi:hypothetical protein